MRSLNFFGGLLLAFLLGLAGTFYFKSSETASLKSLHARIVASLRQQIDSLEKEREEANRLRAKFEQQAEAIARQKTAISNLQAKRTKLRGLIEKRANRIVKLLDENKALKAQLAALKARAIDASSTGKQIAALRDELKKLQADRQAISSNYTKATEQRDTAIAARDRLRETTEKQKLRISQLLASMTALKSEVATLKAGNESSETNNQQGSDAAIASLRAKLRKLQAEQASASTAYEKAVATRDKLRGLIEKRANRIVTLLDQNKTLKGNVAAQQAKAAAATAELGEAEKTVAELRAQLRQNEVKLARLGNDQRSANADFDKLERALARAEQENSRLSALQEKQTVQIQTLTTQNRQLDGKSGQLEAELQQARNQLTGLSAKLQRTANENDRSKAALAKFDAERLTFQQRYKSLSDQIAGLSTARQELQSRMSSLRESLASQRLAAQSNLERAKACQTERQRCVASLDAAKSRLRSVIATQARACEDELARIAKTGRILFASGSARLTRSSFETLDRLAGRMQNCNDLSIRVEGHTDSSGNETSNKELSEQRAGSVLNYLVEKGVPRDRLSALGFGSSKPVATNVTPEGRRANRRIQFSVSE